MKGLEAAIRNALAKAGETNAQTRARIYQSARSALETGLRKQGIDNPAIVGQQRHRLEAIIELIEREERQRYPEPERFVEEPASSFVSEEPEITHAPEAEKVDAPPQVESAPEVHARTPGMPAEDGAYVEVSQDAAFLGGVAGEGRMSEAAFDEPAGVTGHIEHEGEAAHVGNEAALAEPAEPVTRPAPAKKRRRWRARAFSLVILIAFGAAAYWWAESSGLLLSPQERDTAVRNPPPTASDEDFEAPGLQSFKPEQGFGEGWVSVFEPAASAALKRGVDVGTEFKRDGDTQYLVVSAPAGGSDSAISVDLPQSLLRQMAGHRSMIAVTARGLSANDQLSVACEFAGSDGCGNHRFKLTDDRADLIFEVDTPAEAADSGKGAIVINVAAGGADGEVELYGIHIAPDAATLNGA